MKTVLEALRRPGQPTDEEFIDAVIRTHERIRSKLRALGRERFPRDAGEASDAGTIIHAYFLSHGVETRKLQEPPRAEPRWQVV